MLTDVFRNDDKKVEFIELIYDLIFVYLVGKNNAILHHVEGGFFTFSSFLFYLCSTLVVLQIWYFSSLYINRYGENSIREHVFLFINMYLLYFLADGIGSRNPGLFTQYSVCWSLILVNIAVQYFIQLNRLDGKNEFEATPIKAHMITLLIQAAIILIAIPVSRMTGSYISWIALVFGAVATFIGEQLDFLIPMDSEHLTERIMLYMVFTFGETILSISGFFADGFTFRSIYFSLSAFLIVAGLFLIYGLMYNRIIERDRYHIGMFYMLIHIGLILMLNNITVAMELMGDEHVILSKNLMFLTFSMILYYLFMYMLKFYSKRKYRMNLSYLSRTAVMSFVFAALMYVFHMNATVNIIISVVYVYSMLFMVMKRMIHVDLKQ